MKGQRHRLYSLEFKQQAVLFSSHPDIQVQDVAEILGIHPFMLSRLRKELKEKKNRVREQLFLILATLNI